MTESVFAAIMELPIPPTTVFARANLLFQTLVTVARWASTV